MRRWLNPKGSYDSGFIIANVEAGWRKGSTDATLRVGDCNRTVTLEFSYDTPVQRRERLAKIDRMIEMLETMQAKMVELECTQDQAIV